MVVGIGARAQEDHQVVGFIDQHLVVLVVGGQRRRRRRGRRGRVRPNDLYWRLGLVLSALADLRESGAQVRDIVVQVRLAEASRLAIREGPDRRGELQRIR